MSIDKDGIIEALKVSQLDLRAENARLQERVKEVEGGVKMLRQELGFAGKREKEAWGERNMWADTARALKEQRDGYAAQSEQRREALDSLLDVCTRFARWHPPDSTVQVSAATTRARAAIDISPEEAKEK